MAENVSVVFFPSLPLNVNRGPLGLIFSPWSGNRQTLNLSEWMGMDANAEQLFPPCGLWYLSFFFYDQALLDLTLVTLEKSKGKG
jgi:hypothetical protein